MSDYRPYLVRQGQRRYRHKRTGKVKVENGWEVLNAATCQRYAFRLRRADALQVADDATERFQMMRRKKSA